ncbi:uncharacterized protein RSE6_09334 [Rhynchosporium secalis]|uniref:Uncharacterized protein n=1 Tax=Rhynchosporium secalis TaxID=38038 RepID=A0A1E1MHN7_RHYSE|nr:uncharacterized protein RSE6_09334 [Rhynchosporium secalis]
MEIISTIAGNSTVYCPWYAQPWCPHDKLREYCKAFHRTRSYQPKLQPTEAPADTVPSQKKAPEIEMQGEERSF